MPRRERHLYNWEPLANPEPPLEPLPPEPSPSSGEDNPEARIEGEPEAVDSAPATALPRTVPPPRLDDAVVVAWLSVSMLQERRPRWSRERCRAWVLAAQAPLRRHLEAYVRQWLTESLHRTAPTMNMDRQREQGGSVEQDAPVAPARMALPQLRWGLDYAHINQHIDNANIERG